MTAVGKFHKLHKEEHYLPWYEPIHRFPSKSPPPQHLMHSQMVKELKRLKEKQEGHDTHLQFIKDFLRNSFTPRSLLIKTILQTKDTNKDYEKDPSSLVIEYLSSHYCACVTGL